MNRKRSCARLLNAFLIAAILIQSLPPRVVLSSTPSAPSGLDSQSNARFPDKASLGSASLVLLKAPPQQSSPGQLGLESFWEYHSRRFSDRLQADINLTNGNLVLSYQAFSLPGRGIPLVLRHVYNQQASYSGDAGRNWTHNFNLRLSFPQVDQVVYRDADGTEHTFVRQPDGTYLAPPGVFLVLTQEGTDYRLTKKSGLYYRFDAQGRLTEEGDLNGNRLQFTYTSGRLASVAHSATTDKPLTFTYNAAGLLSSVQDWTGRAFTYAYTGNDLTSITDPLGLVTAFEYPASSVVVVPPAGGRFTFALDAQSRVTSLSTNFDLYRFDLAYATGPRRTTITDGRGNATTYEFNSSGNLTRLVDALGKVTTFAWNNNLRTSVTDARNFTTNYFYDARGNLLRVEAPLTATTIYTYTANDDLASVRDANGNTTTYEYDANRNLTRVNVPVDGGLTATTIYTYDANGNRISMTDPRGFITTYAYNTFGQVTSETDPLFSLAISYAYDSLGRLTSQTDRRGNITGYEYDAGDRLTRVTDAMLGVTQYAYDANGNRTRVTDAKNNVTVTEYNKHNLPTRITDALLGVTSYQYDAALNQTVVTDANLHNTTYAYDALNRIASVTDALGNVTSYQYDAVGNQTAVTDGNGNATRYEYDALNRLTRTIDALNNPTSYTYDLVDNRLTVTDARNNTTRYTYTPDNRLKTSTDALNNVTTYAYDKSGNLLSVTDARNNITRYEYNANHWLSRTLDPLNNATTYAYDAAGNISSMTDPLNKTTTYTYDALNRMLTATNPLNQVQRWAYDAVGNLTSYTDEYGNVTRYEYDALNRLSRTIVPVDQATVYAYDAVGNRTSVTAPNGIVTSYAYFDNNWLRTETDPAGTTTYAYDRSGNTTRVTEPTGATLDYAYDAASRLTSETRRDPAGNLVQSMAYTLDAVGNRTRIEETQPDPAVDLYVLRVNAGGGYYTDTASNVWAADRAYTAGDWGYTAGGAVTTTNPIDNTLDDPLFQAGRAAWNFDYLFDVPNGTYQVRLLFAEFQKTAAGQRVFEVDVEGIPVLTYFDIYATVGPNYAFTKTVTNIGVADGQLNLDFDRIVSDAIVSGIEVIQTSTQQPPPPPPGPYVQRVNAGSPSFAYIDGAGNLWAKDRAYTAGSWGYVGGSTYNRIAAIANTNDDPIYYTHRLGNFEYRSDVPNGTYQVTLHFAEIYWTVPNRRLFDVDVENLPALTSYDVYAEVGGNTASVKTFTVGVTDSQLNIIFYTVYQNLESLDDAMVSAIEVVQTSDQQPTPTPPPFPYVQRIDVGGGGPYTDGAGNVWARDRAYRAGRWGYLGTTGVESTTSAIANTTDDPLYQTQRREAMEYRFDLPNGTYQVRLLFAEIKSSTNRTFNVNIEDTRLLINYNIYAEVGANTATQKTYTVVVNDGKLNIEWVGGFDPPVVSAIEVVQTSTSAPTPTPPADSGTVLYRMNSGGLAYTDVWGRSWTADTAYTAGGGGYVGGNVGTTTAAIANTPDDPLYQNDRNSGLANFEYRFDLSNGTYEVKLHFADFVKSMPGQRRFNVDIEGVRRLSAYDIVAEVGTRAAVTKTFSVNLTDGRLDLVFSSSPTLAAIEVIQPAGAGALGLELEEFTPTPELSPTATETPTPAPTETSTPLPTETPTPAPTPLPTDTPTPPPTDTATPTPTPSDTPTPTSEATPAPTATPSAAVIAARIRFSGLARPPSRLLGVITRVTVNEYDALNRLTRTTDPSSLITTYQYDAVGNLSQTSDPLGITTTYTYDARNLPTRADRSQAGNPLDSTTYAYDARGSLIDSQLTVGSLVIDHDYAYNASGQISESFLYPQHYLVQYGSPRVSMSRYFDNQTTGDGGLVYLQYFGNGWLERSESENFGQAHGFWGRKRYDYDGGGNRRHMYFHHPTWPSAITRTDTYNYDGNKLLSIVSCGNPCGATWPKANFGHDAAGNLNFEEWFDDQGRVTKRQSYGYDSDHRIERLTIRDGRVMRFDYDHLGRLEYIRKPGGSLHLVYEDETHHLIREEWSGTNGQSYILAEYKWVNGRPHSFTAREGATYNTYYYEYNWRGDVAFLRRPDGTAIQYPFLTGTLDYSMNLFGQNDNSGPHNRYRWNAQWGYLWIPEAGLYLIGQRWYHPDIGRWMTPNSPDYIYANNDPVNLAYNAFRSPLRLIEVARWGLLQDENCEGFLALLCSIRKAFEDWLRSFWWKIDPCSMTVDCIQLPDLEPPRPEPPQTIMLVDEEYAEGMRRVALATGRAIELFQAFQQLESYLRLVRGTIEVSDQTRENIMTDFYSRNPNPGEPTVPGSNVAGADVRFEQIAKGVEITVAQPGDPSIEGMRSSLFGKIQEKGGQSGVTELHIEMHGNRGEYEGLQYELVKLMETDPNFEAVRSRWEQVVIWSPQGEIIANWEKR